MTTETFVFVIDDDAAVRDSLTFLLKSARLNVKTFASAKDFLATDPKTWIGCLVTDIRLPEMNGLDLQEELRRRDVDLPMIIITGHGDVPLAVRAMRAGAVDFLEKPFEGDRLASVQKALDARVENPERRLPEVALKGHILAVIDQLTPREREVFDLLITGKTSKMIARKLAISDRTVAIHRARIISKMGASSTAELIHLAFASEVNSGSGRSESPYPPHTSSPGVEPKFNCAAGSIPALVQYCPMPPES